MSREMVDTSFDCFKASPGAQFYDIDNVCGIYQIKNDITGTIYVGSSHIIRNRILYHFSRLRSNKHNNSYLQHSYNKYGPYSFSVSILEVCDKDDLMVVEQKWIDLLFPDFNLVLVAGSRFMLGKHHTQETKEKIGEKTKSRVTQELIDKMIERNKGNTWGRKNKGRVIGPGKQSIESIKKRVSTFSKTHSEHPELFRRTREQKENLAKSWRKAPLVLENLGLSCICEFYALSCFCEDNNLSYNQMWKLVTGKISNYKGWVVCQG